jgi:hypothetical protein
MFLSLENLGNGTVLIPRENSVTLRNSKIKIPLKISKTKRTVFGVGVFLFIFCSNNI